MKNTKQTRPAKKNDQSKRRALLLWLAAPPLILLTSASAVYIIYAFWHTHTERGQFSISDTFVGSHPARSLDLKVAARAEYPSSPLTVVRDLGVVDGLRDSIFKYEVKDDNLTEFGLMVTPSTPAPPKGYPVIVLLHGYANPGRYRTAIDYLGESEIYARQGFLVVKPDLRGQGESIDQGFADSAYYSMSYNTDVLSLVSALRQTGNVDKDNINLWGHSMGAYLALRAAVLSKDIKNIILLSGPVDDLEEMYITYIPPSDENNPYALATRNEVFARYGTPADNRAFWHDASPINYVADIKGSVQINVGLDDGVVPPQFSAALNAALDKTKVRHQYNVYADAGHGLTAQRPEIYAKSLQILKTESGS